MMRWLTNLYDPTRHDAPLMVQRLVNETNTEAWEREKRYLADKVIGRPHETIAHTVDELERMGMVGVYSTD